MENKIDSTIFWEGFNEPIERKPLIDMKYSKEEIIRELEDVIENIKNCDSVKVRLLKLYEKRLDLLTNYQSIYQESPEELEQFKNNCDMVATTYDEKTIKVTLNNNVAVMPKVMNIKHYQELRDYYIPAMNKALDKINPKLNFEKAFILFVQTFSTHHKRDLDNTFKSFVFDSLRFTRIIPNDTYECLTYYDKGVFEKGNPRTEIYITDINNRHTLFGELG